MSIDFKQNGRSKDLHKETEPYLLQSLQIVLWVSALIRQPYLDQNIVQREDGELTKIHTQCNPGWKQQDNWEQEPSKPPKPP